MLRTQIPQCPKLRPIASIGISHFSFHCDSICSWLPLRSSIYHELHCSVPLQCSIMHLSQRTMEDPSRPPYIHVHLCLSVYTCTLPWIFGCCALGDSCVHDLRALFITISIHLCLSVYTHGYLDVAIGNSRIRDRRAIFSTSSIIYY